MKAETLKKLIDDITGIGYEIMQIQPEFYSCESLAAKHLTGAYKISIAPIKKDDDKEEE